MAADSQEKWANLRSIIIPAPLPLTEKSQNRGTLQYTKTHYTPLALWCRVWECWGRAVGIRRGTFPYLGLTRRPGCHLKFHLQFSHFSKPQHLMFGQTNPISGQFGHFAVLQVCYSPLLGIWFPGNLTIIRWVLSESSKSATSSLEEPEFLPRAFEALSLPTSG